MPSHILKLIILKLRLAIAAEKHRWLDGAEPKLAVGRTVSKAQRERDEAGRQAVHTDERRRGQQ